MTSRLEKLRQYAEAAQNSAKNDPRNRRLQTLADKAIRSYQVELRKARK